MLVKLKHVRLLAVIFALNFVTHRADAYLQSLSPENFSDLYRMAARGDVSGLNSARSRGLNINSVNSNGDTGLCVAARHRDRTAFRTFLQAGANAQHPCTWNVSGYENFKSSVMTNNVRNADTARTAIRASRGMSWTTKALIGTGVVAAAAGTAIAVGGGGGGGGHSSKCVHGHEDSNKVCICDAGYAGEVCNQCASGYDHYGDPNNCYLPLACVNGTQVGGTCLCNLGYGGTLCDECAQGYGMNYSTGKCVAQSADVFGNSVNVNYNNGDHWYYDEYLDERYIYINNYEYANVYGLFYDAGDTYAERRPAQTEFVNAYWNNNFNYDLTYGSEEVWHSYSIYVDKNADGDVYGMCSKNAEEIYNIYVDIDESIEAHPNGNVSGSITLSGRTAGNMYGIYGNGNIHNADYNVTLTPDEGDDETSAQSTSAQLVGYIYVANAGSGNAYGMYNSSSSGTVYNENKGYTESGEEASATIGATSSVHVYNNGSGNAYGFYSKGSVENSDLLNVGATSGAAYGIVYGDKLKNSSTVNVESGGDAYGAYDLQGSSASTSVNSSTIKSKSTLEGNAYGVYLEDLSSFKNTGTISVSAVKGDAYGVYANNSIFTHSGTETQDSLDATTEDGNAYGIYATGSESVITNTSNIKATVTSSTSSGNAFGIYNVGGIVDHSSTYPAIIVENSGTGYAVGIYSDGGTVTNTGRIIVTGNAEKSYGIYATNGATIINDGEFVISVNNDQIKWNNPDITGCTGTISSTCYAPNMAKAIYIDQTSTLLNAGAITSAQSVNLNSMMLTTGGSISAPSVEGNAGVSSEVVSEGFSLNYTIENAIISSDTSALNLYSESALFNAALDGEDIVLSKKAFADIAENKDVADFLEKNYALSNNEELFKTLKESKTLESFNAKLDDIMGQSLTRFAFEDLTTIKELDFEISEKMFENKEPVFHLSGTSSPFFFENNKGSRSSWGLNGKQNANSSFGVGVAFSNIRSQDKNNNNDRSDQMFQVFMPMSVKTKGTVLSVTPHAGYSYGTYERDGYKGETYDGKIEKRILGLMSSVSYPLQSGSFTIAPRAEFNAIGYRLKGHEENKQFALNIEKQNVMSVEGGVGLHFGYSKDFSKKEHLKINNSLMMYHEFADPYELELSVQGMSGTYRLRDEKRRDERIALKNGLEYETGVISFYTNVFSYIDSEYKIKADIGLKYNF